MKTIIRKIGIYFSKPIWSFIRNCVFWLFRLNKIKQTKGRMSLAKGLDIDFVMVHFKWQPDKVGDWTQWPSTLIYNDFTGDCDDAAALAKWWFKEHGVEAEILNLYSDKSGHTICVTKDRTKMVTNERVVNLNLMNWEKEVLGYFGNKYTTII